MLSLRSIPNGVAIYFSFAKLPGQNNHKSKLSLNLLEGQHINFKGKCFLLDNNDIVVITPEQNRELINRIIFNIRYMFVADEISSNLIYTQDFCKIFALRDEFKEFTGYCDKIWAGFSHDVNDTRINNINKQYYYKIIESIENRIEKIDIYKFIKLQPIYSIVENSYHLISHEIYVSIIDIKKLFDKSIFEYNDFLLNNFLFNKLDPMIMDYIVINQENIFNYNLNINLLIASVLEHNFIKHFIEKIPDDYLKKITIEFSVSDVFNNITAFSVAKNILNSYGIKTCIDSVNNIVMMQIDRKLIGSDYIKLQWNADIAYNLSSKENTILINKIINADPNNIILSRCDIEEAINYGKLLGINYFQGWFLDKM